MKRGAKKVETRGRKPLPEGEKRDKRIVVKATEAEREQIEANARAAGKNVGVFLRELGLGGAQDGPTKD